MRGHYPKCLMIGGIREDYCITHDGRAITGVIGGNAVYAAVGARLWTDQVGILSRIGRNYPLAWLDRLEDAGISTSGVRVLDQELDSRTFYAYRTPEERVDANPIAHYARWGLHLPEALKGYRTSTEGQEDRNRPTPATIRPDDLSAETMAGVGAAHLSPSDYLTHLTLPHLLQEMGVKIITLDPSIRYMTPGFRRELPNVLQGLSAFLPSMYEATALKQIQPEPVWNLTDYFHSMGPPLVVIKAGKEGQYISDAQQNKRWHIPAYPTHAVDVTGAGDAFCGAFLYGLLVSGDPLEAALRGNVTASFVIEGSGALYALEKPRSLLTARLSELRKMIREE